MKRALVGVLATVALALALSAPASASRPNEFDVLCSQEPIGTIIFTSDDRPNIAIRGCRLIGGHPIKVTPIF